MITIIKESGFCHGVQSAIDRANGYMSAVEAGQKVYLYGDLVNNSHVMGRYLSKGFLVTNDIAAIAPGSTVIIRAHGVPQAVYENLLAKGVTVEDCTCAKVKNTHKIVEAASAKGSAVVVVGKKDHPEVVGICGWCKNAAVLETMADIDAIPWDGPVCVVGQTTCKQDWWDAACNRVLEKCPGAAIHQTLCNFTAVRNKKAADIARTADHMIIVGDKKSANSVELYDTCRQLCANTMFVSSLEELQGADLAGLAAWQSVGLVGSASAPPDIVDEIYDSLIFAHFLALSKMEIEGGVTLELERRMSESKGNAFVYNAVHSLYGQSFGGKCIRGAMIRLGERIVTGATRHYLPVATAYELFQTAILIHDDIIDRSDTRRGNKTIHAATAEARLAAGSAAGDARHFGMAKALCVGDYGLFLATNIVAGAEGLSDGAKVRLLRQFSEIQLTTLEGEIMDVTLPVEPIDIDKDYDGYMAAVYEIYRTKTAWYTLAGPLMMGAIAGGAGEETVNALRDIAIPIGIAFQIKDDLLGMYASDAALGKPAISDLVEKKQTLIYGYAYKHATGVQKAALDRLYGKQDANQADLEAVQDIFTETGAKQFGEDEITTLSQESLALIEKAQISDECKGLLRGLVAYLMARKY